LCSCLLALARLGAAQTWQAAWAMRDDRRILAIHHPYVETILSSFPEAVARGQMLAVLASPQAPDDRISGAAQALGHWGHSADEALLLAPLGTHLIVSEQWSHALGRLATQGTLPQLAQALRRSARTASQREVDEITLGHGLASCPDDGFWQEVARCAATSADPIEVSLATRALADGHRPGQRDLLLRSLRERHGEPAVVTTLAHAAAQLPGHDAAAEVMQVLLDPGFPIADKRKIIAWITSQDLQLAVVSQARRLQSGPGHAHLVWGNLRSLDNVAAQQIAAAIARDGTEDAGDRGLALLFAQCLDEHQVIHLLADREPFVRECAILDLADNFQREPNALAALLDCLAHDPVAAVRAKAAQGLFNFEPDNDPACCQGEVQALSTDADVGTRIEAEKSMIGVIVNTFTPPAQRTLVLAALVAAQQRSQVPAELAAIRAVIAGKSDPITTQNPLAGYYDGSGLNYHYQHVITVPDPAAAPAGQPGPKSNG